MAALMLAHGGTAGLVFEVAFLAVPVAVFTAMALVSRRRSRKAEGADQEVEP